MGDSYPAAGIGNPAAGCAVRRLPNTQQVEPWRAMTIGANTTAGDITVRVCVRMDG
jgi:hypothetical protein